MKKIKIIIFLILFIFIILFLISLIISNFSTIYAISPFGKYSLNSSFVNISDEYFSIDEFQDNVGKIENIFSNLSSSERKKIIENKESYVITKMKLKINNPSNFVLTYVKLKKIEYIRLNSEKLVFWGEENKLYNSAFPIESSFYPDDDALFDVYILLNQKDYTNLLNNIELIEVYADVEGTKFSLSHWDGTNNQGTVL